MRVAYGNFSWTFTWLHCCWINYGFKFVIYIQNSLDDNFDTKRCYLIYLVMIQTLVEVSIC